MIPWKEQRELLERKEQQLRILRSMSAQAEADAIHAALARLDAAEAALDEARTSFDRTNTRLSYAAEEAYDALRKKQDAGRRP